MSRPSKKERKAIRRLASMAYEREMNALLRDLAGEFERWQKGDIDCWELDHLIHKYHNGSARDLWKKYNAGMDDAVVAWALLDGILNESEIPEEVSERVDWMVEVYRNTHGSQEEPAEETLDEEEDGEEREAADTQGTQNTGRDDN